MIREQPKSPEHPRQTIELQKVFRRLFACTLKIMRGLLNNPKIPDIHRNYRRSPEYYTTASHSQAQFFSLCYLFGPNILVQSIVVLQIKGNPEIAEEPIDCEVWHTVKYGQ